MAERATAQAADVASSMASMVGAVQRRGHAVAAELEHRPGVLMASAGVAGFLLAVLLGKLR